MPVCSGCTCSCQHCKKRSHCGIHNDGCHLDCDYIPVPKK